MSENQLSKETPDEPRTITLPGGTLNVSLTPSAAVSLPSGQSANAADCCSQNPPEDEGCRQVAYSNEIPPKRTSLVPESSSSVPSAATIASTAPLDSATAESAGGRKKTRRRRSIPPERCRPRVLLPLAVTPTIVAMVSPKGACASVACASLVLQGGRRGDVDGRPNNVLQSNKLLALGVQ